MMEEVIAYLPIIFISMPLFITIVFYHLHYRIKKHKWKAIHFSVQYSALCYIIADIYLVKMMFNYFPLGIILIFLLIVLAIILIIQWKQNTEVILMKGLTVLWRVSFLLFSVCYIALLIYVAIINL